MVSAILLAAGESKRLKGENKLIKILNKKHLINHSIKALVRSKVDKIIVVLGYQSNKVKKLVKKEMGFIIVHSDMPYIKSSDINKIYNSIKKRKKLVHVLKYKNKVGNPIGFDISVLSKFKKIKGEFGAKFMVKRLKKQTNFIKVTSGKIFKDLDVKKDFS